MANETKHTKGPWLNREGTILAGTSVIATVAYERDIPLVIAAPDLLEALDELLTDVGRASSMRGAVKARAAIARATGA